MSTQDDPRARPLSLAPFNACPAGSVEQQAAVLKTLLNQMELVVWATDTEGNYTLQEGRALAAMGLSPGQDVGKNIFELYGWENGVAVRKALQGEHVHNIVSLGDIDWECWTSPMRDERGEIVGAVGLSLNVTKAQRTARELEAQRKLNEQRQAEIIRRLETPILEVWDLVLALPMVGVVDSQRAAHIMDELLAAVTRRRTRFVILDLTGVEVIDFQTASYIVVMIRALRLLGAEGIITGIRPSVAQTVVTIGFDLSSIVTLASLREGLALAIRRMA